MDRHFSRPWSIAARAHTLTIVNRLDVHALLGSLAPRWGEVAAAHDVLVTSEAGTWVHGDAEVLSAACLALVESAAQRTPNGTRIWVTALRRDDVVDIVVEDDGPGFSDQVWANDVVPALAARTGDPLGTGWDLAAVDRLGAVVSAATGPSGSTFTMTLPAA